MKTCPCCNIEKPRNAFAKDKYQKSGKTTYCILCLNEKAKRYNRSERGQQVVKNRELRSRFIDPEGFRESCRTKMRNYNKTSRGKYYSIKYRAKREGTAFSMDKEAFISFFEQNKTHCHYCSQPMIHGQGGASGNWMNSLSIDRKDNSLGYVLENIVCACRKCNTIKGNWFTYSQMVEIAKTHLQQEHVCV